MFADRRDAGRQLAARLADYSRRDDVLVLALPRGGVSVAFEVVEAIGAPLDFVLVCKLGVPGHEELAMGAIASGGVLVLNFGVIEHLEIPDAVIEAVVETESWELTRRENLYRANRAAFEVADRTCIVIDDGSATGASMQAAVESLGHRNPAAIVVAVPVASAAAADRFREQVEQFIAVTTPEPFEGVGHWYEDFAQTTDLEVQQLLNEANQRYTRKRSLACESC